MMIALVEFALAERSAMNSAIQSSKDRFDTPQVLQIRGHEVQGQRFEVPGRRPYIM